METAKAEPKQPTYSEKVRMTNAKIGQSAVKPPRNTIINRPEGKEGEVKTSLYAGKSVQEGYTGHRRKEDRRRRPNRGNDEPRRTKSIHRECKTEGGRPKSQYTTEEALPDDTLRRPKGNPRKGDEEA